MTRKLISEIVVTFGMLASLAACSGITLKEREDVRRAQIEDYAGQPVDHFTWSGRYDGWKPMSANEALVWTSPRQAYLIKVSTPCRDLRSADRIELTSTLHTVYSRKQDYVKVRGEQCAIEQIRPVDYTRLNADLHEKAKTENASASAGASGDHIRS